jgi:hypothetical protein
MGHWIRDADYWLQIIHYLVWFPLIILVISALLRAGIRRYLLIFLWMVAVLLTAVVQMPASLAYHRYNQQGDWLQSLHAISEGIYYPLTLAAVVNLIYRASATVSTRHLIRIALGIGAPLFIGISFALHYDHRLHVLEWMTPWNRDINFCAAILDLVLWALLLVSRERDHRLLLLAGGMGINFAGDAISAAIRSIAIHLRSYPIWASVDLLSTVTDVCWLYIWWQALRAVPAKKTTLPRYGRVASD